MIAFSALQSKGGSRGPEDHPGDIIIKSEKKIEIN